MSLSIPIVLSLHPWSSIKSTYIRKTSGRIDLNSVKWSYYLKRHFLKCLPPTRGVKLVSRLAFTPSCILKNMLSQNNSFLEEFSWEWCLALIPPANQMPEPSANSHFMLWLVNGGWCPKMLPAQSSWPYFTLPNLHCYVPFYDSLSVSVELCQCKPQILTAIAYYRALHIIFDYNYNKNILF